MARTGWRHFLGIVIALGWAAALPAPSHGFSHALTLFEAPKYKPGFRHFDYVNPKAPKGGTVRLDYPAAFDSLNPYIMKGVPAPGMAGGVFESLMARSLDEPQAYYPLLAEAVDYNREAGTLRFRLNRKARWHDGTPVTAEDVVFSFHTLVEKGDPVFKLQYAAVDTVERTGQRTVTFTFKDPENRDIPFLIASMPVFSKAYFEGKPFDRPSLTPPIGSGPYTVSKVVAGRTLTFERVKDYWGAALPSRTGHNNFDTIRYEVYRDSTVAIEAFKSRAYDVHEEYIARNWATAYEGVAVERGDIVKYTARHKIPRGMQAFIFNQRRDKFKDRRVREAIAATLDFEWMNRTIFFDAYERNNSFFQNTRFQAIQLPTEEELKILEPYRDQLPPSVFTHIYKPPVTDGTGNEREELLKAQALLNEAGWHLNEDGWRQHKDTGEILRIEFLSSQKTFERVVGPMILNLKRLGIQGRYRLVDDAQYMKRVENKDFDITSIWWNLGLIYPGNEQLNYWLSEQADVPGSMNMSGMKHPAVDAILKKLVGARNIAELETAARALDRVLLWEQVVIPHWSLSSFRVVYWNIFEMPAIRPIYGLGFDTWWIKPEKSGAPKP